MAKSKVERESTRSRNPPSKVSSDSSKRNYALNEIQESALTKERLGKECLDDIITIAEILAVALRNGGKIAFFGNGGSAADAQHIAAEFIGKFATVRPPLRAIAFTTNTSVLTAIGNDFGFDDVFSRQAAALIDPGDVVVGISTSGRSRNVIKGIEQARRIGAKTIALTGASGGDLAERCDYSLKVPSSNTQRIQECHIMIGHILCGLVENDLTAPHEAQNLSK